MTTWPDVCDDTNARKVLDYGFVVLRDRMGNDTTVVESARVSYGAGTKKVSEDRGLIRYLMRHRHTTPFEMVEFRFLMKMPIFVARQMVRHRSANINEYSGRYSVMANEFYVPDPAHTQPQSKANNQGRSGTLTELETEGVRWLINAANEESYHIYETLLGNCNDPEMQSDASYGMYDVDGWFDESFPGLARELARGVLNVNNYTEWYWKIDLHNLLHLLHLRSDPHAQYEIQQYAEAIEELITPYVPLVIEAYHDYKKNGITLSRMEKEMVIFLLQNGVNSIEDFATFATSYGLSGREQTEFRAKLNFERNGKPSQPAQITQNK